MACSRCTETHVCAEVRLRCAEKISKIFVGGLAPNVTDADFKEYFGAYGPIVESVVMTDKETSRSRGFGFITFESYRAVDEIMKRRDHTLKEKVCMPAAKLADLASLLLFDHTLYDKMSMFSTRRIALLLALLVVEIRLAFLSGASGLPCLPCSIILCAGVFSAEGHHMRVIFIKKCKFCRSSK